MNQHKHPLLHAVPTLTNPADLMANSLAKAWILYLCYRLGIRNESHGLQLGGTEENVAMHEREEAKMV